jgi:uncharacterized protein (DUF362 family)
MVPAGPKVGISRGEANYAQAEGAIRRALGFIGLEGDNPLRGFVNPGDCVLLKPNLIRESHIQRPHEWEQVITHGAVIRAIVRLVVDALQGSGRVIIADGPQTDSDFDQISQRLGLAEIVDAFRREGVTIDAYDLRRDRWFQKGDVVYKRMALSGDPAGYTTVDLAGSSEFSSYRLNGYFYGADYDVAETVSFHTNGRHAYVLCRSVMDADVVINLPKLKTHKKTGVTLSLKNMVGINGYRNCLPHFTLGSPSRGGDEFSSDTAGVRFQGRAILAFKKMLTILGGSGGAWARTVKYVGRSVFGDTNRVVRSGNWYGNDTTWRMALDLNKALFYFDGSGRPRTKPLRYLTIVDGIIAGEGDGPMAPDPVPAGLIVAGFNPVAVDTICCVLMGFDPHKVPIVAHAWQIGEDPLVPFGPLAIRCFSNAAEWNGSLEDLLRAPHLGFKPHFAWRGHIERDAFAEALTL